uniref:Uncharacterized protein n=1 Tax=Triticum urartu TaxID=4572 RepID=A0A8R7VDN0_TRIUA
SPKIYGPSDNLIPHHVDRLVFVLFECLGALRTKLLWPLAPLNYAIMSESSRQQQRAKLRPDDWSPSSFHCLIARKYLLSRLVSNGKNGNQCSCYRKRLARRLQPLAYTV